MSNLHKTSAGKIGEHTWTYIFTQDPFAHFTAQLFQAGDIENSHDMGQQLQTDSRGELISPLFESWLD